MVKWLIFLFLLTLGATYYHYPGVFSATADRISLWLGLKDHDVLYRWQDENGNVKISDTLPAGRAYEIIQFHHDRKHVTKSLPGPTAKPGQ